ncbi:thiolase family protein [Amycolatopsis pithecellobii]|uniref:Acetyl-CoA C-acyltransferase n=1 Tax=Amycolatopsis pithecellobii TaxID=664692 RepID=A0A6N7YYN7_9PSEU|nr:thiolase family protein [Amycolatopsis pithecellobii]MTD54013.1 acetyl-CoA C-acyltransferase [Amycolatopsis pithecellobii]
MPEAFIVDAVRSPVGRRNGILSEVHPADLSGYVLQALIERVGVDPGEIDDVVWGCVNQSGDQAAQIGRYAVLAAGWPESVPGTTVNRACGSSQQAIDFAAGMVKAGLYDLIVAGGVESMSRVPLGASAQGGRPYGDRARRRYAEQLAEAEFPAGDFNQGFGAELIARRWGFDRAQLDELASESHARMAAAVDTGAFDGQIVPIPEAPGALVDEGLRRGTSPDTLSKLRPSFRADGVIHAGNASQISDGSAAVLIASGEKARSLGLRPIARYVAGAVAGSDPVMMLTGPIPATRKLLTRAGVALDEIGTFEVNEAFAPVPMAWMAELGVDDKRVNPQGGAIAMGHPLGGSGAILLTKMLHRMRDQGIRYGLQTMCEGGGTANATLVELAEGVL